MSWRFKASKYKNAAPKVPKPDEWVRDLNIGSYQINGQVIKASASFMAFNADVAGSNLYVIPLNDTGRKPKNYPLLHAHSDLVTDLDFSPFDDGLLATGSQDSMIKLWSIPECGLSETVMTPECTLTRAHQRRIENVLFHPVADFLLSTSSGNALTLWDIHKQEELMTLNNEEDVFQSLSWKADGSMLATTSKDKKVRIWDPRANSVTHSADSHSSNRESVTTWLGASNRILTSGFDSSRQRQVFVRDVRNFAQVEFSLVFDSSTGLLLPLFDADTQMLFLAGKGDNTIGFHEVNERDPILTEGLRHTGQQSKGACLVPKRALRVMEGEANRVLQLTANAVVPISYIVPRKSYREFHADLFPETAGSESPIYASQWMTGTNATVEKILLDPSRWQGKNLHIIRGPLSQRKEEVKVVKTVPTPKPRKSVSDEGSLSSNNIMPKPFVAPKPSPRFSSNEGNGTTDNQGGPRPVAVRRSSSLRTGPSATLEEKENNTNGNLADMSAKKRSDSDRTVNQAKNGEEDDVFKVPTTAQRRQMFQDRINSVQETSSGSSVVDSSSANAVAASPLPKRATRIFGRVAKFRHLHGTVMPRNTHLENFRGLDNALPTECNGFHGNPERVAVPLNGPGGRIAILELKKGGRLPDGPLAAFFNTCKVLDFSWDPFNSRRLAVACDDGRIRLWEVNGDGGILMESSNEPTKMLEVAQNTDRITVVVFHPLAADVMASVSADYVIRIWDIESGAVTVQLEPHPDQVFGVAWSPCGSYIASVCKDGKVRIFEPRASRAAVRQGAGPNGVKGARVTWALDGKLLLVSGFDKSSQRLLYVFRSTDLTTSLNTLNLDVSPTLLIPYYDEDSATLFLTGKGDTTIHCYEVSEDPPHLFPLSHHKCSTALQGLALLPKHVCQVKDVEFARFVTLTSNSIEPLSFTVPRVKNDYFQDDLFPPTKVLWQPSMTASQWFAGANIPPKRMDLKPNDMETLSSLKAQSTTPSASTAPPIAEPIVSSINGGVGGGFLSAVSARKEREKGAQLEAAISSQLEVNLTLEQDGMVGVDESEWDN